MKTALIPSRSCPELEWLEPRLLLNAGALTGQQEADLLTGLAEWSSWAQADLEAEPLLQQSMPIAGVSLLDALDAGEALTHHLHEAVQAGLAVTDTVEGLAAYLDGLDGAAAGGLIAQYDDVLAHPAAGADVSIGLRLSVRGEQLVPMELGAAAEAVGLMYDAAPEVPLTGAMRFDLSFGLAGGSFFLESSRLELAASVDAEGIGFPAQFRLADLQVVGGSMDLHAGASVEFAEIDVGGVTGSDIQAFSVAVAGEARADGVLPLQGNPGEIVLWEDPELVVTGTDLLDSENVQVNVALDVTTGDRLIELDQQVRAAVSDGLDGLVDWLRRLGEAGPLGKSIPEIGKSLGEVLALDEAVASRLAAPVGDYLDATAVVTLDSLLAELDSLSGSSGGVTLTRLDGTDSLADGISVAVHVDRTVTVELDPFAGQDDVPLLLDAPVEVTLHVQADLSFRFGVDFSAWPSASEAFCVEFNEDPQIQATIDESSLTAPGRVGLLEVQVQGGSAQMAADVAIPGVIGTSQRRTLGDLRSESADGLATGDGSLTISLPLGFAPGRDVSGVLGVETPTFLITDDDVFDGTAASLIKQDTAVLEDFRILAAGELLAALTQIGEWMAALQESPGAVTRVPLTQDLTVAEVADHAAAYQANVTGLLSQEVTRGSSLTATQPAFSTVQGLADQLGARVTGLQYNAGSRELVLGLSYDEAQGEQTAAFRYEEALGLLRDVTSDSTVRLTPQVSHTFELGVVLEPVGSGFQLTRGMLLDDLNAGVGVLIDEAAPGEELADLRITLRSGATFEVILDGAQTVGDVLDRLGAAAPPDPINPGEKLFAADIHADGHRLMTTDRSRGDATFRIRGANGSLAGFGLGILGEFIEEAVEGEQDPAEEDAVLDGKPLHGQTLADYVFLRNVELAADLALQADDVDAGAAIGFVGVTVTDGTASGAVTETHESAGRATLHERFSALDGAAPPAMTGTLDLNLPVALAQPMAGVSAAGASVEIHAGDVANLPGATVTPHNLDDVLLLEPVSRDTILSAMGAASDFVADAESLDSLAGLDLGLFATGVVEQIDLADAFEGFVAGLSTQGIADVQSVEGVLEQQLDLLSDGDSEVTVSLDAGGMALRVELAFAHQADGDLPVSLDITGLGLSAADRLQDVAASDPVSLEAEGTLGLVLGIDLAGEPGAFLYDTTSIVYEAGAQDGSVGFDTSLGPVEVSVSGGQVRLSYSEADASNPAAYSVTLTDPDADDRHALSAAVGEADVAVAVEGWADASLPMEYLVSGSDTLTFEWDLSLPAGPTVAAAQFVSDYDAFVAGGDTSDLSAMSSGWQALLDPIVELTSRDVFGVPLPLVGDALADAITFLADLRDSVLDNFALVADRSNDAIRQVLFDALGPGGLDWLQDADADADVDREDIVLTLADDSPDDNVGEGEIQYNVHLARDFFEVNLPISLDLNLPGLGFDVDGDVRVRTGFDFHLGFGLSLDDGVYFDVSGADELTVFLEVTTPGLAVTGTLGFVQLDVNDNASDPTSFSGSFSIDLLDGGDGDGRLTVAEVGSAGLGSLLNASLNAYANVDLQLVTSFGGSTGFPRLRADFNLDWAFAAADGEIGSSDPTIGFTNVQINLGDFINQFAGPILRWVSDIVGPIEPALNVLTDPLPVISDLAGEDVTLVDLARMFGRADVAAFLQSVADVAELVKSIPEMASSLWIDLGAFSVAADAARRLPGEAGALEPVDPSPPLTGIREQMETLDSGRAKQWTSDLHSGGGGSISFPLIENPLTAFSLLLGNDVDLFLFDMAPLGVDFSYSRYFPIPPFPIVGAEIGGRVFATADLAFGFDTSGMRKALDTGDWLDVFTGFFISDRANADGTGEDVPEVQLGGSLTAGAKLNLAALEAGVRGGIHLTVDLNLHDDDDNGRIRFDELARNWELGPIHIFDVSGSVDAGLEAFASLDLGLFSIDKTFELARVTLVDFAIPRPDGTPVIATQSGQTLTLQFTEDDDRFKLLAGDHAGDVTVEALGFSESFSGISRIEGDAGGGDDRVTIGEALLIPVELYGGAGSDELRAGGGDAIFHGGDGDDELYGGGGDDRLYGDSGDDVLRGGAGNDVLDGGDDRDRLDGGRGNDTLRGGAGNDFLAGGTGADHLEGGGDDDTLHGDSGDDTLLGDEGNDALDGGRGDDRLFGGPGGDVLLGGNGADEMYGEAGDDLLIGGLRNDVMDGGAGADRLDGEAGNDTIRGGDGDDVLIGAGGSDFLYGDAGRDVLYAGAEAESYTPADADDVHELHGGEDDDVIHGDLGVDTIYGGGGSDIIYAYAGSDFVDGEAGDDHIYGGDGADVLHGGGNDDVLHGGEGLDLLYGDGGSDLLYGDAGAGAGGADLVGQQLYGGDGIDYLFAWAASTDAAAEALLPGDELFGGAGNDWLYGNLRAEVMRGEGGNDFLHGDKLAGPGYGPNTDAARVGAGDTLYGGFGEDQLYGGGGGDELWGGGDSDWLEGQDGRDALYGGTGIDMLVLDVRESYVELGEVMDGQYGNETADDVADDNATDILLVEGTDADDHIRLSEAPGGQLRVEYNGREILAAWRAADGTPLVEQFRVSGLMGDDVLEFAAGDEALDLSALAGRVGDWVGVLDGGPGNDVLVGTALRDRLDGGRGSDKLYGLAGDDRLWGDGGAGLGLPTDVDQLFAGGGDDDLIGGQGRNVLAAWTYMPFAFDEVRAFEPYDGALEDPFAVYSATTDGPFGVYVDAEGGLHAGDDGGGLWALETTGLNRMLGSARDDVLYGGTVADFLYGNGGDDRLVFRDGEGTEQRDGGAGGDEWKEYARRTDKVWYVSGSGLDDVISLDYVTEPGLLAEHHLVTRLTNNGGVYTFAAQVRLDFLATDAEGNYVWDPEDVLLDVQRLRDGAAAARAGEDPGDLARVQRDLVAELLPPEGDFEAIIIDALGGNDRITVGPTVQKTVWIDAGPGDDDVQIASGEALLPDDTEQEIRNDDRADAHALAGPAVLIADEDVSTAADGDYSFTLAVNGGPAVEVTLRHAQPEGGTSVLAHLVAELNVALESAGLGAVVVARQIDGRLALATTTAGTTGALEGNAIPVWLGFAASPEARGALEISCSTVYTGLTIDSPTDEDWYALRLTDVPEPGAAVALSSLSAADGLEMALFAEDGQTPLGTGDAATPMDIGALDPPLEADTTYVLRVLSTNAAPTRYSLTLDLADGADPVPVAMATSPRANRRDVLLGGEGSDRLAGGGGEDWIFGGPGNDVLTGGADRQASDLLAGGPGNDRLQIIPDALPLLAGTETTYVPTTSDQLFGGEGIDEVIFLGGDTDAAGRPVNDHVAVRYNTLLHRYELGALVWDTANQQFLVDEATGLEELHLAFYQVREVEKTVFDVRAGDDVVRGDAGYTFPGRQSEWGIDPGDAQQGGSICSLEIHGGAGNDQLYGGAYDDRLYGDAGIDTLVGGGGDDVLEGGDLHDFLAGDEAVAPDAYEWVWRDGAYVRNDFPGGLDGAVLPSFAGETLIRDLTLGLDDQSDSYFVPAPLATQELNGRWHTSLLKEEDMEVLSPDGVNADWDFFGYVDSNPGGDFDPGDLNWVGTGPADYYKFAVSPEVFPDEVTYDLRFSPSYPDAVYVTADETHSFQVTDPNASERTLGIPAGDLNGDGYDDVLAFETIVADSEHYVRILFGSPTGADTEVPGSALLVANDTAPADGRLAEDVVFDLEMDDWLGGTIELAAAQTADNQTLDDLVADLQAALYRTVLGGDVAAGLIGDRLAFWVREFRDNATLVLNADPDSPAVTELHFTPGQTASGYAAAILTPADDVAAASVVTGDLTGDGFADILAIRDGRPAHPAGTAWIEPEAYLLAGGADAWYGERMCEISDRVFTDDDFVTGRTDQQHYQWRAANVGDVNGDGKDDLAIGDSLFDHSSSTLVSSRAYLFYGRGVGEAWVTGDPTAPADATFTAPDVAEYLGEGTIAADFLSPVALGHVNDDDVGDFGLAVRVQRNGWEPVDYMACLFYGVPHTQGGIAGDGSPADQAAAATITGLDTNIGFPDRKFEGLRGLGDLDGDGRDEIALDTAVVRGRDDFSGRISLDALTDAAVVSQVVVGEYGTYPAGQPTAVGDLDRDGLADLGLGAALQEGWDKVLKIVCGARYDPDGPWSEQWAEWMVDIVAHPDALISPHGQDWQVEGPFPADRVALAGDLDGDGRDDLLMTEPEFAFLHVFADPWAWAPYMPQGPGETAVPYTYGMALPLLSGETSSAASLVSSEASGLEAFPYFGGTSREDSPNRSVLLGDINGDGFDDFLLQVGRWDDDFILFGPCDLAGPSLAAAEAAIRVDSGLGFPAERPGDYTGDGIDDLAFLQYGESLFSPITITVVPGGWDLPGALTESDLPADAFQFSLTKDEICVAADAEGGGYNGEPVLPLRFLRYDEDDHADLLVVSEEPVTTGEGEVYGYIFSGADLDSGQVTTAADAKVVICRSPAFDNQMLTDALDAWPDDEGDALWDVGTALRTAVAGDINGDGLDDLVLARINCLEYSHAFLADPKEPNVALVTTMTGKAGWGTRIRYVGFEPEELRMTGVMLGFPSNYGFGGKRLFELGDVDGDGYGDFAVRRDIENTYLKHQGLAIEPGRGGLLVFRGSEGIGNVPQTSPNWEHPESGFSQAALVLRHSYSPLYTLAFYSLSTGDFNADGRADLAVGDLGWRLTTQRTGGYPDWPPWDVEDYSGAVHVFWSVGDLLGGSPIVLSEADLVFQGEVDWGGIGFLAEGPAGDATGDGIDDLLMPTYRGGGRVYVARGGRVGPELTAAAELLTNRTVSGSGDYLVDAATGQPITFDRVLPVGQAEAWFTFTTLGDGLAGDYLAVSPAAGRLEPGSRTSDEFDSYQRAASGVLADLYDAAGGMIDAGKAVMDLRGLAAGTYYVRVYNPDAGAQTEGLPYTLEFDVPAAGQTLPQTDRDRLLGGGGDDVLIGNADIDGLFGQDGEDSFYAEDAEVRDLAAGEPVEFPAGRADERIEETYRPDPVDPELALSDFVDANLYEALLTAVAASKGIPTTLRWDNSWRAHTTVRQSDLTELLVADLSDEDITDLAGLEQFVNLRELSLAGNPVAHLSPLAGHGRLEFLNINDTGAADLTDLTGLTNLVAVSADGNAVPELPRLDGLGRLEYLSLAGSDIRDLATLFGEQIIDDGDAWYGEARELEWQSNVHRVDEAHDHDYRFAAPGSDAGAWWRFRGLADEPYEVLVTWPALPESGAAASFEVWEVVSGPDELLTTVTVDQSGEPTGPGLDGRPWVSLGVFDTAGEDLGATVRAAQDGFVAADAVRVVPTQLQLPPLDYLNLSGNPLGNRSRDDYLPRFENAGAQVILDVDLHAPVLSPVGPQQMTVNRSLEFDDDVVVLPHTLLDGRGDLTVEFWCRVDTVSLGAPRYLVSAANTTNTNELLLGFATARQVAVWTGLDLFLFDLPYSVQYGWHHLAFVRDGESGDATLYVDGTPTGTQHIWPAGTGLDVDEGGLILGQDQDSLGGGFDPSQAFDGGLDELRFWDRARTSGEIAADLARTLRGDEEGLLAYYPFDEIGPMAGLEGSYWRTFVTDADWYTTPDLRQIDPVVDFPYTDASVDFNGIADLRQWFSVRWTGVVRVDAPGSYTFRTRSDDDSWLYVDGDLVVDNGGPHHPQSAYSTAIALSAGYHSVDVRYNNRTGSKEMELSWLPPGGAWQPIPGSALYHDLSGDSTGHGFAAMLGELGAPPQRTDGPVAPFGETLPFVEIELDAADADGDAVTYTVSSDDLVAGVVGSTLTLQDPPAGFTGPTRVTVTAEDEHGRTDTRTFDVHLGTNAVYGTKYADDSASGQRVDLEPGLLGEYYRTGEAITAFPVYDGLQPVHTNVVPVVDFAGVSDTQPFAGFDDLVNDFAARWTGKLFIDIDTAGPVTFWLHSDDGARLYVDGQLVVNSPGPHGPKFESGGATLSAGLHDIRMEFYEHTDDAWARLWWQLPGDLPQAVPADLLFHAVVKPGLDGWEITCTGADPTFTDVNGDYVFADLDAGVTYTLAEVQQDGWQRTGGGTPELTFATLGELARGVDFGNLRLDTDPPTVVDVLVAGTGWDQGFLDFLEAEGLGSGGYALPVGSTAQLGTLPWVNVDRVRIAFSEGVTIEQGDLAVLGVSAAQYGFSGFAYDPATFTATWTLAAPVEADKLLLALGGDLTDAAGNPVDGEWTDAVSTYPSGDGSAGGDFLFRLNVLPGDADANGEVRSGDVIKVRRTGNTAPGDADYSCYYDVDCSSEIRSSDVIKVRRRGNTVLPPGEPMMPKPTANLAYPTHGSTVSAAAINAAGYIDVTFIDPSGSGLNASSILDGEHEFALSTDTETVFVNSGTPTHLAGNTYRYFFTHTFVGGPAYVDFVAASFADNQGTANDSERESFTVEELPPGGQDAGGNSVSWQASSSPGDLASISAAAAEAHSAAARGRVRLPGREARSRRRDVRQAPANGRDGTAALPYLETRLADVLSLVETVPLAL